MRMRSRVRCTSALQYGSGARHYRGVLTRVACAFVLGDRLMYSIRPHDRVIHTIRINLSTILLPGSAILKVVDIRLNYAYNSFCFHALFLNRFSHSEICTRTLTIRKKEDSRLSPRDDM